MKRILAGLLTLFFTASVFGSGFFGGSGGGGGAASTVLTYFLSGAASGIAGYEQLQSIAAFTPGAPASATIGASTTPAIIEEFATNVGYPNITKIPTGTLTFSYETDKDAGAVGYYTYAELYKRNLAGTETLLLTSANSSSSALNTPIAVTVLFTNGSDITLLATDRLVLKVYAVMASSTANVSINYDSTTGAKIELPYVPADATNFVPYQGATQDVNLGTFKLLDAANLDSISPNGRLLTAASGTTSMDWETGILQDPTSGNTTVHYRDKQLLNSAGLAVDWENYQLSFGATVMADWNSGQLLKGTGSPVVDWQNGRLYESNANVLSVDFTNRYTYDSGGVNKSIDWNNRQLLDSGGSYPSVDWNQYWLMNLAQSNSYPMLDWSTFAGGSVKIYYASTGAVVGDFSNGYLATSGGLNTIDWYNRQLFNNTGSMSVDWDYHLLNYNSATSIDWQNKYLYSDSSGIISIDYGDHLLNNGGGFLSINYTNHQMFATNGSTLLVDYSQNTELKLGPMVSVSSATNLIPTGAIHVDQGDATASALKLTAGTTTGQLATDGFNLGIDTGGIAEIRQYENLDLNIYTNNALVWTFNAAGGATLPAFDFTLDATTGTKIGTATTQKLGFFNATPVVQQTGDISTALSNLGLVTSGTLPVGSITGVLPLANGGTNKNMTAVNGGVVWTDADSMEVISAGTSGQVLQSNGAAAPTWVTPAAITPTIFGSRGTPRSVVAATGITTGASHMSASAAIQDIYVEGSVAGDSVAATISDGTIDGQRMTLIGRNNSNTVTLDGTTTNVIINGTATLGLNDSITLRYDLSDWVEVSRNF